jgi:hypothetical protein
MLVIIAYLAATYLHGLSLREHWRDTASYNCLARVMCLKVLDETVTQRVVCASSLPWCLSTAAGHLHRDLTPVLPLPSDPARRLHPLHLQ